MASLSSKRLVEKEMGKFPHFIIYAILEWVMIILLFIDGFLAFICNEFATFFDLKIPCLLCTRIDHVLVRRKNNSGYNDSICETHKKDISSLAYCHIHKKLSDIRTMCEGCLLSFATERESDCDKFKSLAGILQKDVDSFVEDDRKVYLKCGKEEGKSGVSVCSCCGDVMKIKQALKRYGRSSSMSGSVFSQAPAPSPRSPMVTWRNEVSKSSELPHFRYTQLKFSDNELEVREDGDGLDQQCREDIKAVTLPLLQDSEDIKEDVCKTPTFTRGNKFFGFPQTDSASASPRWANRQPRKLLLEKPDFSSESNDLNAANEADSDSILHCLKRQVRLDRKSLVAMYMELDEERSASAVAANNAMAMITRLQAEKAAVHMEALQYQRMMEEQEEYDQEALQVMKDMLIKREDEIKVLEAELEAYREKYGQIKKADGEECEANADDDYQEMESQSFSFFSEKSDCGSPSEEDHYGENKHNSERLGEKGRGTLNESLLDFESERSYLLGLLTNLEKKIISPSDDETHSLKSNADTVKHKDEDRGHDSKATLTREVSLIRERLRAIEADNEFLKHATMTLQKGSEGTKLLTEIAENLKKLRLKMEDSTCA